MSSLMNKYFGPLNKSACLYFYILSIFFGFMFMIVLLGTILFTVFRATRILNADFISFYISLMSFFLYISYYSVYFYSNLYYKHK